MPTPISEYGEFRLIEHLRKGYATSNKSSLYGIGDDAAVLQLEAGYRQLVTTDLLLEGIHFDLTYVPLKHLGYKSVVVNLSDVYAMNGVPEQITVSVGISSKFSVEQLEELYTGIYAACKQYNVDVVGGDTSASLNGLVISVTCLGKVPEGEEVYRNGAQINDLVCVTGNLGAAYMGLMLLEREKRVFQKNPDPYFQPHFDGYEYLIERQLKPELKPYVLQSLRARGIRPTAMMDISDGLSSELLHIATQSHVGVAVYEEKLPIDYQTVNMADELNMDVMTAAFNGGEDYELLMTLPLEYYDAICEIEDLTVIGKITDVSEGCRIITRSDNVIPLQAQGWNAAQALRDQQNK